MKPVALVFKITCSTIKFCICIGVKVQCWQMFCHTVYYSDYLSRLVAVEILRGYLNSGGCYIFPAISSWSDAGKQIRVLQQALKMILTIGEAPPPLTILALPPHVLWPPPPSNEPIKSTKVYLFFSISSFHARTHWHTHIDRPYTLTQTVAQCQTVFSQSCSKAFVLQCSLRWERNSKPLNAVTQYNSSEMKKAESLADSAGTQRSPWSLRQLLSKGEFKNDIHSN